MPFDVTAALQLALQKHGLAVARDGAEVKIAEGKLVFSVDIFHRGHGGKTVQLDVRVHSPLLGKAILTESCAGMGEDTDDASRDAFGKFLTNSFHVILAALAGEEWGADQVEWEAWKQDRSWRVCFGPLVFLISTPQGIDFGAFLDTMREKLLPRLSPGYHWLRVYYMRNGKERVGSEALLDNASWPEGQVLIDEWPWPDGKYSLRNFMILKPDSD